MTNHRPARSFLRIAFILLTAAAAGAQAVPDKFTNLKLLPADISKAELMQTMRGFAFALNVRCPYCHLEKSKKDLDLDFAADDKQPKKTARIMLTMTAAINRDYVGKIGKPEPIRVQCVTCHHGLTQPQPMNALLADTFQKQDIDATVSLYRDLRSRYYGTGQYDFGETPLNQFTENLLRDKKYKEAVAIMEMNFAANHPDSVWSYHMLAMAHQANGELEEAKADYRKVLELHPEDSWAKTQLDALATAR
jgi:tetratricopeptide (TPR) repeat protein